MKKLEQKARRYVELNDAKMQGDNSNKAQLQQLRRELSAWGLDPAHAKGLVERAIVYDHRKLIQAYCELARAVDHCDSDAKPNAAYTLNWKLDDMKAELKALGLSNIGHHHLEHILNSFSVEAKAHTKRRSTKRGQKSSRQYADNLEAEAFAELVEEEGEAGEIGFTLRRVEDFI